MIASKETANAQDIIAALKDAYNKDEVTAIVLDINSPGGMPVQSRKIYNAIRELNNKKNIAENNASNLKSKKIYAVINDIGTSAAYLIAAAADEIYADETSFVGSIGALVNSFGAVDAMAKLGIERRLYTAGKNKGMLDPFSPEKQEDVAAIQTRLDIIHQVFIKNVKDGRGDRLNLVEEAELFSGKFWTGVQARQLGLIDGFGDVNFVANNIVKVEKIIDYTKPTGFFDKFSKGFPGKIRSFLMSVFVEPVVL